MADESIPGQPRIELDGFGPVTIPLEFPPGRTLVLPRFETPSPRFNLKINYYLDHTRVVVILGAARDKDILTIFLSRYQMPKWKQPGALYVATVFHGDGQKEPCDVTCDQGDATIDECCVICENGNVIVETCC